LVLGALAAICISSSAAAVGPQVSSDTIDDAVVSEIRDRLKKPVVLISVEAQNRRNAAVQQAGETNQEVQGLATASQIRSAAGELSRQSETLRAEADQFLTNVRAA
jgi:methyl-accepting chemotaxis protein